MNDNNNQEPVKRHKRGDTREDGKLFWCYGRRKVGEPFWVTKEQYAGLDASYERTKNKRKASDEHREKLRNRYHERKDTPEFREIMRRKYAKDYARELKDPEKMQRRKIRAFIKSAFYRRDTSKNMATCAILGCSLDEFSSWIERLFLPGMSWSNRDTWHVDHIIPLSLGRTAEEVTFLCRKENLRPLWAKANQRKAHRLPPREEWPEYLVEWVTVRLAEEQPR